MRGGGLRMRVMLSGVCVCGWVRGGRYVCGEDEWLGKWSGWLCKRPLSEDGRKWNGWWWKGEGKDG